ncbi:MAG: amidase domain-containing protein [Alphaproteobacteria bacterium]|nr:amidase domain-containing protein [Alphaproteobacteria bacterium]
MPYERPPSTGTDPGTKTLEDLKHYSPPAASVLRFHTVGRRPDGHLESLADVAKQAGQDFWRYIDYVFPGCNKTPECVNWYLNFKYNCPPTDDGKNRKFRGGEKLPLPKLDWKDAKPPLDPPREPVKPGMYDRRAAARYARYWAEGTNPAYPQFHNDCTSFVSQALLAGGWTMVGEGTEWDYNNDDVWWYGKVTSGEYDNPINDLIDGIKDNLGYARPDRPEIYRASQTWAGAPALARFLRESGRGFRMRSYDHIEAGDVIQEYDNEKGVMIHTMIVIGRVGDDLEYAQHTDGAIRLFKKRFPTGQPTDYPKKEFVFWKINDTIR